MTADLLAHSLEEQSHHIHTSFSSLLSTLKCLMNFILPQTSQIVCPRLFPIFPATKVFYVSSQISLPLFSETLRSTYGLTGIQS